MLKDNYQEQLICQFFTEVENDIFTPIYLGFSSHNGIYICYTYLINVLSDFLYPVPELTSSLSM